MKRRWVPAVLLSFAFIWSAASFWRAEAEEGAPILRIQFTPQELRAEGIAVRDAGAEEFANSCRAAGNANLSVSDEMLSHFKARGFSLESLCLGLSSYVLFDPETGRALPRAVIPGIVDVPLNLPDCFRNAVPFLECDFRYVHWEQYEYTTDERAANLESAQRTDELVRSYIERNAVSGVFSIEALGQGIFDSRFEWFLASNALPRGYGYALHGGEGEDPESEEVDLSTYRKKQGGSSIWRDDH